jgi:hypothetical protein
MWLRFVEIDRGEYRFIVRVFETKDGILVIGFLAEFGENIRFVKRVAVQ